MTGLTSTFARPDVNFGDVNFSDVAINAKGVMHGVEFRTSNVTISGALDKYGARLRALTHA